MKYTIITGACKGIGRAMAYECASRGMNLLLISNDESCLHDVCADIANKNSIACYPFVIDLTADGAAVEVQRWVQENNFEINILINNVGIGKGGIFTSMKIEDIQYMLVLNNKVMIEMTYHLLPILQREPSSSILNTSSLEATLPLPYKAVYTATKNFIYAFSLALGQEVKFQNIHVSVLCPGPVLTNEEGLMRMQAHGGRSKILMMYPEHVARIALNGMLKRRTIIVPGFFNALFFKLGTWLPVNIKMTLLEKLFRVYKS